MSPAKGITPYESRLNPLDEISLTSAFLGTLFGISVVLLPNVKFHSIILYIISLALFHFLEFYVTAKYNTRKVQSNSFLIINNGYHYLGFHLLTVSEALIERFLFPQYKLSYGYIRIIGLILMAFGQIFRSLAMITAGNSFNHNIAKIKYRDHVLVTWGIYSLSRHPSYAGFFYYVIGVELMLLNPVCLVAGVAILYKFFSERIRYEERTLVEFFGDDYVKYRSTTGTLIPLLAT